MADRVGVINQGRAHPGRGQGALMTKLGKKQLTLNLSEVLAAIPPELADWNLALKADGHELEYVFDGNAERTGIPTLLGRLRDLGIGFKDLNTRQSSLEDIFVSLVSERGDRAAMSALALQPLRRLGDLPLRDGAGAAHPVAEPGDAGHHHLALFRRVRRRDRLAHERDRRRRLWRVHRARADHAVAVHPEHLQRLVRHLLPQVHRHDLRTAVGADLAASRR